MDPKGNADAHGASRVEKKKEVVVSMTPEAPPHSSGDHVGFAYLLLLGCYEKLKSIFSRVLPSRVAPEAMLN